jgi:hypothetical protein
MVDDDDQNLVEGFLPFAAAKFPVFSWNFLKNSSYDNNWESVGVGKQNRQHMCIIIVRCCRVI